MNASSRTGMGGHEMELVGAGVQTESLFFTYGIVELREYLPGDVIIYGRVYRSSRETQKAQEWNI